VAVVSSTLLRGLRLLETVDFYGPLSISALARRLGVDKATTSRMVAACEPDGWLVREADGVRIGPRAAMLGQDAAAGQALRLAEPLVHAVCGVTGLLTQAVALVGQSGVVLASASPGGGRFPYGLTTRFPIWLSAAGKVIASQLTPAKRDSLLPPDPFPELAEVIESIAPAPVLETFLSAFERSGAEEPTPRPDSTLVGDRAALTQQLEGIQRDGVFQDRGEVLPGASCIAVPWPASGVTAALSTIGSSAAVEGSAGLIERTLRAAARSGATRESIVAAAAER
jgi:DNA-binding IclR family transcriptional regulator